MLLWIQQGDGLAMAAAREGTQPLRYVAPLGLRLPASGWAARAADGVIEGELEPGVWMLGVTLDEHALLALVGPIERLRGAAATRLGRRLRYRWRRRCVGRLRPDRAERTRRLPLSSPRRQPLVLSDDGYPASVPLWYDWDGGAFWLVPSPGADWAQQVRHNPRVSLSVSDRPRPYGGARSRTHRGRRESRSAPVANGPEPPRRAIRATRRCAPARSRLDQPRVLLRLAPERLIAWRGLVRPITAAATVISICASPNRSSRTPTRACLPKPSKRRPLAGSSRGRKRRLSWRHWSKGRLTRAVALEEEGPQSQWLFSPSLANRRFGAPQPTASRCAACGTCTGEPATSSTRWDRSI